MPSTYTLNNGIELIATGEQSGTWGDTTNVNLGLIDTALDGQVTVTLPAAGTSGSPNALPISDGSASDGRNRLIIFTDGGDLGATAFVQLTPNDAEKIVYIRNNLTGGRAITLFQGTYNASNDYEVPAGTTAVVFFNGGGAGAVAANVFNNAFFDSLRLGGVSVTAILDEDNMASDSATALATQQSIKAYVDAQVGANNELSEVLANGNTSGGNDIQMTTTDEVQFRDTALKISSSVDGQLDIAADVELEIVAPTLDINASTAVTIDTTTMTMTGSVNVVGDLDVDNLNINGNSIISTNTDGNIALTPNGTGEVDISKVDIDGGTIDGTVIGGSTPAAISGTTITGTSFVTTGDMTFGDNDKAIFGAGSDLQIYHSGSNSIIRDTGAGDLYLAGDANVYITNSALGEFKAAFTTDGAASLYYDNALKLATTSTGIDVTGTVTADGLTVDGNGSLLTLDNGSNPATISNTNGNVALNFDTTNAGRSFIIEENGNNAFRINNNGDISFYEDTGTTPKFFWDASAERLGIGTSSPASPLDVSTGISEIANFRATSAGGGNNKRLRITTGGDRVILDVSNNSDGTATALAFVTGNTERARIDASGDLLVGKTSASSATVGFETKPTGFTAATRDGNNVLVLNRLTSDGDIAQFRKDGTVVGSIGTNGGLLYMSSANGAGFRLVDDDLRPATGSSNADNTYDLGNSNTRWRNLHLSGGVYLGGTTSANLLDDYEEGEFTLTLTPETSGTITINSALDLLAYTKVGRAVTVTGGVVVSSVSSPVGDYIDVPLPFAIASLSENSERFGGSVTFIDVSTSTYSSAPLFGVTGSVARVYVDASTVASSDQFIFMFTYFTA